MTNFYLKSLGCKQNILEGAVISDILKQNGFTEVDELIEADIYILNSCSVTSHSDSQVNYLLNQARKLKPQIKIILTGCCAQTYKDKDFDYTRADLVLGNSEKMQIVKYINKSGFLVSDIFSHDKYENEFLYNPNSTRVSVKIQDGCNNRCSYCIIPYARGKSRSNSADNIIKQIEILVQYGIKEIVLTGIHIGQWGLEFNKTLTDLLREIEKTDIARFRLGSLYINEIDDEMIEFLKTSKKFCPHFHLSLQSLCDKTLKNMNRSYCANDALNKIEELRHAFPYAYFGCDIIVGFPYENDDDFKMTYENLKRAKLSSIHCFPYSKRENTTAYTMPQVQDSVKTERAQKIMELSKNLKQEFLKKNKERTEEILIQKKNPKTGLYSAITRNYIKIYFKDERDNLRHSLKTVNLSEFELF